MSTQSLVAFCKMDAAVSNVAKCAQDIVDSAIGADGKYEVSVELISKARVLLGLWNRTQEELTAIVAADNDKKNK